MRSQVKIVTFLFMVIISMVAVSCGPGNQVNQANQQTPTSPVMNSHTLKFIIGLLPITISCCLFPCKLTSSQLSPSNLQS